MTETGISSLDRERIRELFDLRNNLNLNAGGFYTDDPYPVWHELRAKAAVHKGTVHELTGCPGDPMFHGLPFPERPHFSTFSYEVCDAAYRNPAVFASSPDAVFSREKLLTEAWGYESYPTTRTVDTHILRLRQKLEPTPCSPCYFLTMHGAGYKFTPAPAPPMER